MAERDEGAAMRPAGTTGGVSTGAAPHGTAPHGTAPHGAAPHGAPAAPGEGTMDITEQERTFVGFIRWATRVAIAVIVLLVLLAILNL